jgi:hypothetical protein
MINHTTLALVAVLAAAALVIGTLASPALADSSKTITKQIIKQKQKVDDHSLGLQNANNCITVLSKTLCGQAPAD